MRLCPNGRVECNINNFTRRCIFRRVVYASIGDNINEKVIDDILKVSHRNNERDDITGLLIYKDGCFIQLLEGDEIAVEETLTRISQDPRHLGMVTIYDRTADDEKRSFENWSLAAVEVNRAALTDPLVAEQFMKWHEKSAGSQLDEGDAGIFEFINEIVAKNLHQQKKKKIE